MVRHSRDVISIAFAVVLIVVPAGCLRLLDGVTAPADADAGHQYDSRWPLGDGIPQDRNAPDGPASDAPPSRVPGAIVLYRFDESSGSNVGDGSSVGTPLDLQIEQPGASTWLGPGLRLDGACRVQSTGHANKIVDACKSTNAVTIEAWIQTTVVAQGGPARIVSLSLDGAIRNVTLGHGAHASSPYAPLARDSLVVRMRTDATDANGLPELHTPTGVVTTDPLHIVFAHDADGAEVIYVDRVPVVTGHRGGSLAAWTPAPLFLAGEGDVPRPWLGTLYLVALYDRALTPLEVAQNFAAGW